MNPIGSAEFAALIEALGPFERRPQLAVAVSGGPDSLCLCLLADAWARSRGGAITGLIVDHGLRPTATAEARQVADWLGARRIAHCILCWTGPKPEAGIQAAAREARYRLLGEWCRAAGVLHLLVAHHLDDQAETVALRQARKSGGDGLAGMAAVREITGLRLLRPLLALPKARLSATLEGLGQPWVEDPSNLAAAFARSRLRMGTRLDSASLAHVATAQGWQRADDDERAASWLVANAKIDPAGFVTLPAPALATAPPEVGRRAVQQILTSVGGRRYPPRQARLAGLLEQLRVGLASGRTLAGCRILPWRGAVLICREPQAVDDVMQLAPGAGVLWDSRFRLELSGDVPALLVRALGAVGRRQLRGCHADGRALPAPVRPSLPSLWHDERLMAVPHLGAAARSFARRARISVRFAPPAAVAGAPFRPVGTAATRPLLRPGESLC